MKSQQSGGPGMTGRRQRAAWLAALCLSASCWMVDAAGASDTGQTSQQVAQQIIRIQGQADAIAAQLTDADSRSYDLGVQLSAANAEADTATAQFAQLQSAVAEIAVDRFAGGSGDVLSVVMTDPMAEVQRNALREVALDQGVDALDQLTSARKQLDAAKAKVATLQQDNTQLMTTLSERQSSLDAKLAELKVLRVRLQDAEVKKAYEAELAKRQAADVAEQARRSAAIAAAAATTVPAAGDGAVPSTPAPTVAPAAAPAGNRPQDAPSGAPRPAPTPAATAATSPPGTDTATPEPATPAATDPPVTEAPAAAPAPVIHGNGGLVCPLAGPSAFIDTWGDPRPGGRHHEGVDMIADYGIPIVAVVGGDANFKTNALGGNAITLSGDDGNRYYYAHLSSWEGSSRHVSAGEVMGYVGHTGDTSVNHLHWEIHPGGGPAIDPYPTARQIC